MARRLSAERRVAAGFGEPDPEEVLGFREVEVIAPDGGLTSGEFFENFTNAMRSRSISWMEPNDALDLSRDLMITEAVGPDYDWKIEGTTLKVYPMGYTFREANASRHFEHTSVSVSDPGAHDALQASVFAITEMLNLSEQVLGLLNGVQTGSPLSAEMKRVQKALEVIHADASAHRDTYRTTASRRTAKATCDYCGVNPVDEDEALQQWGMCIGCGWEYTDEDLIDADYSAWADKFLWGNQRPPRSV